MDDSLILASSSPRRRELLAQAGIPFTVFVPEVDESCDLPAEEAVAEISRRKALAAAKAHPGKRVLASDTLVALQGEAMGKPVDAGDAKRMLRRLSGRTHQVYTAVTLVTEAGRVLTGTDATDVTFVPLTEEEIDAYVATGEPLDKAGAYGVQGRAALFISHLDGCYTGVMGLPLYLVRQLMKEAE